MKEGERSGRIWRGTNGLLKKSAWYIDYTTLENENI